MVPFMRTFGYDIRKSIGTAAAVGFLIAISGTTTMIISGKIIDNVNSPFSIGYINLLGFIVFVPVTMIMARLGANVTGIDPIKRNIEVAIMKFISPMIKAIQELSAENTALKARVTALEG